jgi:hypothetical protein
LPLCPPLDSLDLRINMIVENNVEKSRKSFNHANQGSDNVGYGVYDSENRNNPVND